MKSLAGRRSPNWAFMETFKVPQYDGDDDYLTRLRIVQTPWFGLYLHRFDGPDPRPTLHDHPWPFWSFVLRGGYVERRLNTRTMTVDENHRVRFVNRMPTHGAHAIMRLTRMPTWTLMLVGRRVRTWGYLEPQWDLNGDDFEATGWRWTEFDKHPHAREFEVALARRHAGHREHQHLDALELQLDEDPPDRSALRVVGRFTGPSGEDGIVSEVNEAEQVWGI